MAITNTKEVFVTNILDPILAGISEHIEELRSNGGMTGDTAAEAIASIVAAGIQSATTIYLQNDKTLAEIDRIEAETQSVIDTTVVNVLKTEAETSKANAETSAISQRTPVEIARTEAETESITNKTNAEVRAINQKRQTEIAQTGIDLYANGSTTPQYGTTATDGSILAQAIATQKSQIDSWVNDAKNNNLKTMSNIYIAKEERGSINNPTAEEFPEIDTRSQPGNTPPEGGFTNFRKVIQDSEPAFHTD